MSGKERCVNPACTQYGEIQEGPCTFRPVPTPPDRPPNIRTTTEQIEEPYFGNQIGQVMNGRTVKMCLVCGVLAGNSYRHAIWHTEIRNGQFR